MTEKKVLVRRNNDGTEIKAGKPLRKGRYSERIESSKKGKGERVFYAVSARQSAAKSASLTSAVRWQRFYRKQS